MSAPDTIEVEDLFVTFAGGVQAVAGISITLSVGETLGLVGESGSGKTTLAKALVGLNRPSSGRVRVEGRDLTGLTRADRLWLRRRVQMIFQDPLSSLSPQFTIRKLLAEPMLIHGMDKAERWPKVLDLMTRLGLAEAQLEKFPHQISGGQARRVAIARALVTEPSFLIADEPTAGTRRVGAGRAPEPARRPSAQLFARHPDRQPQPQRHRSCHRSGRHHVSRQDRRGGPTRAVFRAPRHPYAHALLSANPVIDPEHKRAEVGAFRRNP